MCIRDSYFITYLRKNIFCMVCILAFIYFSGLAFATYDKHGSKVDEELKWTPNLRGLFISESHEGLIIALRPECTKKCYFSKHFEKNSLVRFQMMMRHKMTYLRHFQQTWNYLNGNEVMLTKIMVGGGYGEPFALPVYNGTVKNRKYLFFDPSNPVF